MKFPKVLLKPIRNFCFLQNFNILICTLVLPKFQAFQNHFLCMQLLPPLKSTSQSYFILKQKFNPFLPHAFCIASWETKENNSVGTLSYHFSQTTLIHLQVNKTNKWNVECNWRQNWVTNLVRNNNIFITTWTNMRGTIIISELKN